MIVSNARRKVTKLRYIFFYNTQKKRLDFKNEKHIFANFLFFKKKPCKPMRNWCLIQNLNKVNGMVSLTLNPRCVAPGRWCRWLRQSRQFPILDNRCRCSTVVIGFQSLAVLVHIHFLTWLNFSVKKSKVHE